MQTIAIVNEKGGTGKTTTSVCLSAAIGRLGRKVLLVDLDGQAASSRWLGVEEDTRFADALWSGKGLEPIPDVAPGVSLAPGCGKLDSVAHDLRPTQGGQLRKLLAGISGFDYTVIDCPPSLGNRLIGNALLAADAAIVPVETSVLALDGLKILLTTLDDIRDGFDHAIELLGVLACRYDARTRLSRLILDELHRALPGKVFKTVIRENVRVRECPGSGQVIFDYAPNSHAAEDYLALGREVMGIQERQATRDDALSPAEARCGLSEQERSAVAELRQQVETLVQEPGCKAGDKRGRPDSVQEPARTSEPIVTEHRDLAEPDGGSQPPVLGTPAELQTVAAEEPVVASDARAESVAQARTQPPPQAWTPELAELRQETPGVEAPASAPHESDEEPEVPQPSASESDLSQPPPQEGPREDVPRDPAPLGGQETPAVEAPASAPPESVEEPEVSQPPASESDLSQPPPQEGPHEDVPRDPAPLADVSAVADTAKPPVAQGWDFPVPAGPGDSSTGLEAIAGPPPPRIGANAKDGDERDESDTAENGDYPALRAMLEQIADKEVTVSPADDGNAGEQDKRGLWRRLMQKPDERKLVAARAREESHEA